MIETRKYTVAEHLFHVTAQKEWFGIMSNYEPFAVGEGNFTGDPIFLLMVGEGDIPEYGEEYRQEADSQKIVCGTTYSGLHVFEFQFFGKTAGCLVCSADYREGHLLSSPYCRRQVIDNTLMVMFSLATVGMNTLLFHGTVVSQDGHGYVFLGPSGTGKSTHARLWQQHLSGVELVNDDNPVVRIWAEGRVDVYGSPWSGKTSCYRNVSFPLGGMVLLKQSCENRIKRLSGVHAYAAVLPAISGKRWNRDIADNLHASEIQLVNNVSIWSLECLPDQEAAELCESTISIRRHG